tara:strand:- start:882 stop:1061 length:180 start_codon:yes stop_codon:yes gene_type:complete
MKLKDTKLFLNSVKKINDKYIKSLQQLKIRRVGVEMSESHSSEKYYVIDKTNKGNKENK